MDLWENAGLLKLKPHEEMPFSERKKVDGKHVPAKGWNFEQSSWLREAVKEVRFKPDIARSYSQSFICSCWTIVQDLQCICIYW